jgi:hypothetical protein
VTDAIKARRERLSAHFARKINGHENCIFVVIVSIPCGLVPIGIKPFADRRHTGRKLRGGQPDGNAVHQPLPKRFCDASTFILQAKEENC